jgi:hypothetical protein
MSPLSGTREESAMNSCTRASVAPSNQRSASAAALLGAVLFGCGAPAAKALLGAVDPLVLAGLLYLGSGFALAIARVLRGPRALGLARRDGIWLSAAAAAGGVIAPLLLLVGLSRTSASCLQTPRAPITTMITTRRSIPNSHCHWHRHGAAWHEHLYGPDTLPRHRHD